jgi:hypothetical protein
MANKKTTNVVASGRTYPTANPDFKPADPLTTTRIDFNKDGSINYTPKGSNEAITLSKEEYSALQGKEGFVTDKTKKIQGMELNPLQPQQEALRQQQSQELAALGEQDFTKIGQEQSEQDTNQQEQGFFNNIKKIGGEMIGSVVGTGNLLTSGNAQESQQVGQEVSQTPIAQAAGTTALGALGIAGGVAAAANLPTFTTLATRAKTAKTSLAGIKVLGYGGTAAAYLYNALTDTKVKDVEGDINDMVTISKTMASRINQGADGVEVRSQIKDMEEEIIEKIAELNKANRLNVKNRYLGIDSQEYARKQLTKMALYRQAVENYILTKDINSLNAMIGLADDRK